MNKPILPFYMTYPLPIYAQEEDTMMRDLEYLQQMYPSEARIYQKKIAAVLDKIDYDGSLLYDEYPCKWQIYRLVENIVTILKQEAAKTQEEIPEEKWVWIEDMVQILLCHEIYKRRHKHHKMIKSVEVFGKYI